MCELKAILTFIFKSSQSRIPRDEGKPHDYLWGNSNQSPNTCETRASHPISWHFKRRRIVPCTAEPIVNRILLSQGLFLVYLKQRTEIKLFIIVIKAKNDEITPHDPKWADTKINRLQPKYLKWRAMLSFKSKPRVSRILLRPEQITRLL